MRVSLAAVTKGFGSHIVLSDVSLGVGPRSRIGLVGPNGVGKSTLLRVLAGLEEPDAGTVAYDPPTLTIGYLPQEPETRQGETLRGLLERRTGVAEAERELTAAAEALAAGENAGDRYERALARFLVLGGADFDARARTVLAGLGLDIELERDASRLSGGQAARASLAAILLSRHDVLLLDEPTNDLDFDGLSRLERFLDEVDAALVVVSHDRALLGRVVTRIVEIEPGTHRANEYAGGWSDYVERRDADRRAAYARFDEARERRNELAELLARRRTEARSQGAGLGEKTGGADRRGTNALRTKVRQAERLLTRNELPDKPFEPWRLRLTLDAGTRPGGRLLLLTGARAVRGSFSLGPLDLDLVPGERLSIAGPNGSGKSTLLAMLTGALPLSDGDRQVGRAVSIGVLGQGRETYGGNASLLDVFIRETALERGEARTLLAKFGLGVDHVARSCASLSPGERTRAHLAELQAREVNVLVLDEPTNHLDVEAIEQLEEALGAYDGTIVVVSHDRRFLEALAPTREVDLGHSAPPQAPALGT
jgi:ATPase subunit of ABC transporter with duplicated ATPase domains